MPVNSHPKQPDAYKNLYQKAVKNGRAVLPDRQYGMIDYLGNRLPETGMAFLNEVVDDIAHLSVITKIEVLGFDSPKEDHQVLSGFIDDSIVLYITEDIAQTCIDLRKNYSIKLQDAIIAATALVYGMDVVTRNKADFEKIGSLKVVNPHEL